LSAQCFRHDFALFSEARGGDVSILAKFSKTSDQLDSNVATGELAASV